MTQPNHRFFSNTACQYFPCHAGADPDAFNCLFCFCPLYRLKCPGTPRVIKTPNGHIKDCSACAWPHHPDHYDGVLERLRAASEVRDTPAAPHSRAV